MAQDGPRLARIVIAVVAEEHDASAELFLEPPRREDLGGEEPPREEAARLLAERDDDVAHAARPTWLGVRGPRTACRARLATMQMAQPITLYQRYPRLRDRYMAITRTCATTAATKTALPPTRRTKTATRKIPRI